MKTLDELRELVHHPNVSGFLRVLREGETNQTYDAYRMINGGGLCADFTQHPYAGLTTTHGGKPAGAYQFLPTTWGGLQKALPGGDFSPPWQDLRCVQLIDEHPGALAAILQGAIARAIALLRATWTSLPGATENASRYTLDKALAVYRLWGGRSADPPVIDTQPPAPVEERDLSDVGNTPLPAPGPNLSTDSSTDQSSGKKTMDPITLISVFGPLLANLIPQVAKLFSSGSEVATRNVAAATTVLDTVVKAAGAANIQQAVEKMQSDPVLAKSVQQAVVTDPTIMGMLEVGGGIEKARAAGIAMQSAEKSFLWNPVFWISLFLLPLASYVVFAAITGGAAQAPWWVGSGISAEAKVGIISSVISLLLGGIAGIWFGTSYGSMKKDERAAQQLTLDPAK